MSANVKDRLVLGSLRQLIVSSYTGSPTVRQVGLNGIDTLHQRSRRPCHQVRQCQCALAAFRIRPFVHTAELREPESFGLRLQ